MPSPLPVLPTYGLWETVLFPINPHHCFPSLHLSPSGFILSYFPVVSALCSPRLTMLSPPALCRCRLELLSAPWPPIYTQGEVLGRRRGIMGDVFLSEVFKACYNHFFLWLGASIKIETNFAFPKWADNCSMTKRANTCTGMASAWSTC